MRPSLRRGTFRFNFKKMKVKLKVSFSGFNVTYDVGQIYEATPHEAQRLLAADFAELIPGEEDTRGKVIVQQIIPIAFPFRKAKKKAKKKGR